MKREKQKVRDEQARCRERIAIRTLLLLAGLLALILVVGCAPEQEGHQVPGGELPDQQLFNSSQTETADGVPRWILKSDRTEKFTDREEAELYGVTMFFYRDGELFSTLTAERGRANLTTKNMFAWGNVVIVTEDGRRLETEELHYDNQSGYIFNDVFDRFTHGEDVMTGIGMEATPDFEYFTLKNEVKAEVGDETAAGSEAQ